MSDATLASSPTRDVTTARAVLYRMVMPGHLCPFGLKSRWLLRRNGYEVEDHPLTSREETEAFQARHDVETTPQTFIGGERIGGYDDLRAFFGHEKKATTYAPVIALFAVTALMALAASWATLGTLLSERTVLWFIGISMCALAIQKLRDLDSFSTMFLNYDLLARRWVTWGFVYPFFEAWGGIGMIAELPWWAVAPFTLMAGGIGAVSVFKAVYVDKRELKCACMGGDSNVPLGFVSLTENLMMVAGAIWMILS